MNLGEAIDQVLKLAEHTAARLPETHTTEANRAIDFVREFGRSFCISHTDKKRREQDGL